MTKSFEYVKCLETANDAKSLGYEKCPRNFFVYPVSRSFPYSRVVTKWSRSVSDHHRIVIDGMDGYLEHYVCLEHLTVLITVLIRVQNGLMRLYS